MGEKETARLHQVPDRQRSTVRLITVEIIDRVAEDAPALIQPAQAAELLCRLIGDKDREHFVALHLDVRHRVIAAETVSIGSLNQSLVHAREVFKAAILNNAHAILCGHNHPSGDLTPSPEDQAVEARLRDAGRLLGIPLLDFVIVSGSRYWAREENR